MKFINISLVILLLSITASGYAGGIARFVGMQKEQEILSRINDSYRYSVIPVKKTRITEGLIAKTKAVFNLSDNDLKNINDDGNGKLTYNYNQGDKIEFNKAAGTIFFNRQPRKDFNPFLLNEISYQEILNTSKSVISKLGINLNNDYDIIKGGTAVEQYDLKGNLIQKKQVQHIVTYQKKINGQPVTGKGGTISFLIRCDGTVEGCNLNWYEEDTSWPVQLSRKSLTSDGAYRKVQNMLTRYKAAEVASATVNNSYDVIEEKGSYFLVPTVNLQVKTTNKTGNMRYIVNLLED